LFDIDNPTWDAVSTGVEGFTNIPVNRLYRKIQNLRAGLDSENAWWQRVAVTLGWSKWDVGIDNRQSRKEFREQYKDKTKEKDNIKLQKQEREEGRVVLCAAVSRSGNRCGNKALPGQLYCTIHDKVEQNKSGEKKQCKGKRTNGEQCKMLTSAKSGYCYYHD